jgi:multidrug efflux pump subunit AcrA (membrane-fusion protein)
MKKGVRIIIILVVVLVVLALGGFFGYTRLAGREGERPGLSFLPFGPGAGARRPGGPAENPQEKFSVPVAVAAATLGSARETLALYGSVFAEAEVGIPTTVNGKISEIKVEEGDVVGKDQVLAVIDRDQAGRKEPRPIREYRCFRSLIWMWSRWWWMYRRSGSGRCESVSRWRFR